jgi:hypothetical protein
LLLTFAESTHAAIINSGHTSVWCAPLRRATKGEGTMIRSMLLILLLSASQVAAEVPQFIPETGVYANAKRSGEGAFIEVQGNIATISFFTHTADGDSTFYTAGGPLFTIPANEQRQEGYYPATRVTADLYKTVGGPVLGRLTPGDVPYSPQKVGLVTAEFGYLNQVEVYVRFDDPVPPGSPRQSIFFLQRLTFGLGTFGRNNITDYWCWPDFTGEWIFVDHSDESRAPLRFKFAQPSIVPSASQISCPINVDLQIMTYRDEERDAELRCVLSDRDPIDGLEKAGCELRIAGTPEPLFWFGSSDLTPTRMVGSLGAFLPWWARTPNSVTGIRVR